MDWRRANSARVLLCRTSLVLTETDLSCRSVCQNAHVRFTISRDNDLLKLCAGQRRGGAAGLRLPVISRNGTVEIYRDSLFDRVAPGLNDSDARVPRRNNVSYKLNYDEILTRTYSKAQRRDGACITHSCVNVFASRDDWR